MFSLARARSGVAEAIRILRAGGEEFLFQRAAEGRARSLSLAEFARLEAHLAGVDRRLRRMGDVGARPVDVATATLLRDAASLVLAAGGPDSTETEDLFARACDELHVPLEARENARRLLRAVNPLELDALDDEELGRAARALADLTLALRRRLDGRSVAEIRRSRWLRVVATVAGAGAVIFFCARALFTPPNVARDKPVQLHPFDPRGAAPSALVDGVRSAQRSPATPSPEVVETQRDPNPWALIDLERPFLIREIRVYNRDDGYFDDCLPYVLEVSSDGVSFTEVGRRTEHFGSWWFDAPWVLRLPKVPARYVRIRGTNFVALSEVEVRAW